MSDEARAAERALREAAEQVSGQVIEGGAKPLQPRRLPQMVSLRLDPDVLRELRDLARESNSSVSELLREGASLVVSRARSGGVTQLRITEVKTRRASGVTAKINDSESAIESSG